MTNAYYLFTSYSSCTMNHKVTVTDGCLSSVMRKWSIQICNSIVLNYVFYVPNLFCILIFINQLTKGSYCFTNVIPSHCFFQNPLLEKTIDNVKECEELYYFDDVNISEQHQVKICDFTSIFKDNEILLQHYRMSRFDFQYMKQLIQFIFQKGLSTFIMKFVNLPDISVPLFSKLSTNYPNRFL